MIKLCESAANEMTYFVWSPLLVSYSPRLPCAIRITALGLHGLFIALFGVMTLGTVHLVTALRCRKIVLSSGFCPGLSSGAPKQMEQLCKILWKGTWNAMSSVQLLEKQHQECEDLQASIEVLEAEWQRLQANKQKKQEEIQENRHAMQTLKIQLQAAQNLGQRLQHSIERIKKQLSFEQQFHTCQLRWQSWIARINKK